MRGERAVGGKQGLHALGVERCGEVGAIGQAEHFADQAAARMADQVDVGAGRQAFGQGQRIVDRAFGQCAVFEGEDAVAVGREQALAQAGAFEVATIP